MGVREIKIDLEMRSKSSATGPQRRSERDARKKRRPTRES